MIMGRTATSSFVSSAQFSGSSFGCPTSCEACVNVSSCSIMVMLRKGQGIPSGSIIVTVSYEARQHMRDNR